MSSDEAGEVSAKKRSRKSSSQTRASTSKTSHSSHDYKELYKDAKYELKRKRRDLEELDTELRKQINDAKKAKTDAADLWKVYHTLQTELKHAYEKSAKLQLEKDGLEKTLKAEKAEFRKLKGTKEDPSTLKDALMNMQKEKMELQTKFNDIVIENKHLKDRALTYEPRLREIDDIKEKLHEAHKNAAEMQQAVNNLRGELVVASINKEEVEKYRRWNSLLIMESEQNRARIRSVEPKETKCARLESELEFYKKTVNEQGEKLKDLVSVWRQKALKLQVQLGTLKSEMMKLKMDWHWSGEQVKKDVGRGLQDISKAVELAQRLVNCVEKQRIQSSMGIFISEEDAMESPVRDSVISTQEEHSMNETSVDPQGQNATFSPQKSTDSVAGERPREAEEDLVGVFRALRDAMELRREDKSELTRKIEFVKNQISDWEYEIENANVIEVSETTMAEKDAVDEEKKL